MTRLRTKAFVIPRLLPCFVAGLISIAASNQACSDWNPAKNVELISSTTPGSGPDLTARIIQTILRAKKILDVPMSVVNKPGGNYATAWAYLNQHGGDGHYLLIASVGLLTGNPPGAEAILAADASMIAHLFSEYMVLAVRADSPLKTGRDVAMQLAKDPRSLSIAIGGGPGGVNHLAIATAMKAAGVTVKQLKLVAFNSSADAMVAALGGHVDVVAATATALLHARSGGLRVLAISSPHRSAGKFANVPTWREQGIETVFDNSRFVLGPHRMPREQIVYWEARFAELAATDEWKNNLAANDWKTAYMNGAATKTFVAAQFMHLQAILAELGVARN